jgi:transketolase N-terminal domain/subunit
MKIDTSNITKGLTKWQKCQECGMPATYGDGKTWARCNPHQYEHDKKMTNKQRILDISKKLGLSHIGSCLSALPIYEEIYRIKKRGDIVIADNGHSHLSHLVVKFLEGDSYIEELIHEHGIHCDRKAGCDASGGSLGHGLGIGIGYAVADKKRSVYVIVSDGSMMEGSNWEALRIADDLKLKNLHIHCNFNGYTAVAKSNPINLFKKMKLFYSDVTLWQTTNGLHDTDSVGDHYEVLA